LVYGDKTFGYSDWDEHKRDGYGGYASADGKLSTGWGYEIGYIALPTVGGHLAATGPTLQPHNKSPGTFGYTPPGGAFVGATMHAHFGLDYKLHYHNWSNGVSAQARDEVGSGDAYNAPTFTCAGWGTIYGKNEKCNNVPDYGELAMAYD
jgi:hypothetical protein